MPEETSACFEASQTKILSLKRQDGQNFQPKGNDTPGCRAKGVMLSCSLLLPTLVCMGYLAVLLQYQHNKIVVTILQTSSCSKLNLHKYFVSKMSHQQLYVPNSLWKFGTGDVIGRVNTEDAAE